MQAKSLNNHSVSKTEKIQKTESNTFWKKLVFQQFSKIKSGTLIILDHEKILSFGEMTNLKATIVIHDSSFYKKVIMNGTMSVAEMYMDEGWDCEDLESLFRLFAAQRELVSKLDSGFSLLMRPFLKFQEWMNENTILGSRKNISAHYDLGNDFFKLFLDKTMMYSSGMFRNTEDLYTASVKKCDAICQKLELKSTDHLIEIGTGWGYFAIHAAKNYGCKVKSVTLSVEQKKIAEERITEENLQGLISVELMDYRNIKGNFDKLVSIEMIEAVGHEYLGTYLEKCHSLLKDKGIAVFQAITIPDYAYDEHLKSMDFIQKYIFPGSKIPCVAEILKHTKSSTQLVLTGMEDIALDYAKTMRHWHQRFKCNLNTIKQQGYSNRFLRMWEYYLLYCCAGFEERYLGTVQLQFCKL